MYTEEKQIKPKIYRTLTCQSFYLSELEFIAR